MVNDVIDLFFCNLSAQRQNFKHLFSYLPTKEKQNINLYKTFKLQTNYLVTRAVLRKVLSKYISVRPHEIIFTKNSFGKPRISTSQNQHNIYFNISHSKDILCIAVSKVDEIGIDIEFKDESININDIQDLCLSDKEKRFMHSLANHSLKIDFFYKIWTLKESIVKAIGCGMSYEINKLNLINAKYPHISKITDKVIFDMPDTIYTIYAQTLDKNCRSETYSLDNYCVSLASSSKLEKIKYEVTGLELRNEYSDAS